MPQVHLLRYCNTTNLTEEDSTMFVKCTVVLFSMLLYGLAFTVFEYFIFYILLFYFFNFSTSSSIRVAKHTHTHAHTLCEKH